LRGHILGQDDGQRPQGGRRNGDRDGHSALAAHRRPEPLERLRVAPEDEAPRRG
jgi:hypothetical protein